MANRINGLFICIFVHENWQMCVYIYKRSLVLGTLEFSTTFIESRSCIDQLSYWSQHRLPSRTRINITYLNVLVLLNALPRVWVILFIDLNFRMSLEQVDYVKEHVSNPQFNNSCTTLDVFLTWISVQSKCKLVNWVQSNVILNLRNSGSTAGTSNDKERSQSKILTHELHKDHYEIVIEWGGIKMYQ